MSRCSTVEKAHCVICCYSIGIPDRRISISISGLHFTAVLHVIARKRPMPHYKDKKEALIESVIFATSTDLVCTQESTVPLFFVQVSHFVMDLCKILMGNRDPLARESWHQ